ncbi:MAG TPA: energy transducer TonB [Edaphobacter sp.]
MTIRARSALAILFCVSLQALQTNRLHSQTQPDLQSSQSDQKPTPATSSQQPNPDAAGVYHFGDGVTPPKLIPPSVMPEFSDEARRRRIFGKCTVRFVVETDGHVRDVQIVKSVADEFTDKKDHEAALTLDQKAIEAASQDRFEPGQYQGKPVPVALTMEVSFFMRSRTR